jgi:hypothetical protein
VIVDGVVRVHRSRNTPAARRQAVFESRSFAEQGARA